MIVFSWIILATLVVGTFVLVGKRIIHPLGLPVLAAGSFAYLYLIQPAFMLQAGDAQFYLNDWQITKAFIVCSLMYSAFLSGWLLNLWAFKPPRRLVRWNFAKLYRRGLLLSCVGTGMFITFMHQSGGILHFYAAAHMANGAWEEQTAYVYLGKQLVFPGLAMMLIGVIRGRATKIRWAGVVAIGGIILFHAILTASRGILFPLVAVLGVTSYLAARKLPTTRTVIVGGIVTCMAVLALVGFRSVLHLGEERTGIPVTFVEALTTVGKISESEIHARQAHVEFLIAAGIIDAVDKTQTYNLGSNWLYLVTIHLVPRVVWQEKPYVWQIGLTFDELPKIIGWATTDGSFPSLIGDFYRQFGIFSVLLWFVLGSVSRDLFNRAWITSSPVWQVAYVLLAAYGLHLFAQGLDQVLVFYLYTAVPSLVLTASCRWRVSNRMLYRERQLANDKRQSLAGENSPRLDQKG